MPVGFISIFQEPPACVVLCPAIQSNGASSLSRHGTKWLYVHVGWVWVVLAAQCPTASEGGGPCTVRIIGVAQ